MNARIARQHSATPQRQRGAALLLLLAVVVVAASYTLLKRLNHTPSALDRAADTAAILGEAKAALIGYALKSSNRPGELPCPDSNNSGTSIPTPCTGNVTFRFPWKKLGLPDLRDSSGERLWYVVDPAFTGNTAINSETVPALTIDGGTTRYAAILIAPGKSLQGQTRSGGQQNNIQRYLEADNANNDAFFVTTASGDFNDQLLGITRDELIQAVERRVLKEVANSLNLYKKANSYFPNPAAIGTPPPGIPACEVSAGTVPVNIGATCTSQANWGGAALPSWFVGNGWDQMIWYVVADDCDQSSTNACGSVPAARLNVNAPSGNRNDVDALLIAGGPPLPGLSQNNRSPITDDNDLLDSFENRNDDLTFEVLPLDTSSNDQLRVIAP
ncbi:MAG TPA: hypothetical protein ENK49_05820 [Gammaproteobacteria bacterium]|nr:hypothetical protein [Gammaproteobacteria bacterium]